MDYIVFCFLSYIILMFSFLAEHIIHLILHTRFWCIASKIFYFVMLFTKFYYPFLVGIYRQLYTRDLTAWLVTIGCSILRFRVLHGSFLFCRIVWLLPPTKQSNGKLKCDEHGMWLVMSFFVV